MPKKDTAETIKPHTEAKLQFYIRYLERYLSILLRAKGIGTINIYDMYSGAGIYDDGNSGSAVRAVDVIWEQKTKAATSTTVNLLLNELKSNKAKQLENLLCSRQDPKKGVSIGFRNVEAATLLESLPTDIQSQSRNTRNFVFIDPYGYKDIDPNLLSNIMNVGKTEIVLFLPIEDMYRFLSCTEDSDVDKAFQPLKRFIDSLAISYSQVNSESDFIAKIQFSLEEVCRCYCTSYSIKNHNGRLYAMFFITSNLKGLEKIIEVKWGLDSSRGEGFTGHAQQDFFLEAEKIDNLENDLRRFLSGSTRTNADLYQFVLRLGFLPKQANGIFRKWQKDSILEVFDLIKGKAARKGTFKLNYRDSQNDAPLLEFRLNEVNT